MKFKENKHKNETVRNSKSLKSKVSYNPNIKHIGNINAPSYENLQNNYSGAGIFLKRIFIIIMKK